MVIRADKVSKPPGLIQSGRQADEQGDAFQVFRNGGSHWQFVNRIAIEDKQSCDFAIADFLEQDFQFSVIVWPLIRRPSNVKCGSVISKYVVEEVGNHLKGNVL